MSDSECTCGAQGDKLARIAPQFHRAPCPQAPKAEQGTRILRVDLPESKPLPAINQTMLVEHVKRLWRSAKAAGGDADLVGLFITGGAFSFKMLEGVNPRIFTSRVGSGVSTAAACGSMIDDIRAQGDNRHLAIAVAALRAYISEETVLARQRATGGSS